MMLYFTFKSLIYLDIFRCVVLLFGFHCLSIKQNAFLYIGPSFLVTLIPRHLKFCCCGCYHECYLFSLFYNWLL